MKTKFCPKCRGMELDLVAGGNIGMMECRKCGYTGSIFPEAKEKKKKNRPSLANLKEKKKKNGK